MRYTKPALTYEAQLQRLIGRGLIVKSENRALHWLERVGYYRLSAYLYPFRKSPTDDNFRPGSSFETAVQIYKFDCELRLLVFQALERIEVGMRASATYHLSHALGPFGYTLSTNYTPFVPPSPTTLGTGLDFPDFMRTVARSEKQSQERFVEHYRTVYTAEQFLPLWMATEVMSFGTLSRMIENVSKRLRKPIAKSFGVSQSQLTSWLHCLNYIRNVCAHHGRLWNREISLKPEMRDEWKKAGVGQTRLYCVLLVLEHLYRHVAPNGNWKKRVNNLLAKYPELDLSAMQVPGNWSELDPWT